MTVPAVASSPRVGTLHVTPDRWQTIEQTPTTLHGWIARLGDSSAAVLAAQGAVNRGELVPVNAPPHPRAITYALARLDGGAQLALPIGDPS